MNLITISSAVHIGDADLLLRLAAATALCTIIGFERATRDEVAGVRTHALVGLGAALFTLVSAYGFTDFATAADPQPDPTRIAAQIVTGIGFLGAGVIIRQGVNVRGVTTATSVWIAAAIGMAAGAGFFVGAIAATVLVLAVLTIMRRLSHRVVSTVRADAVHVDVDLEPATDPAAVLALLAGHHVVVESMHTDHDQDGEELHLDLRLPPRMDFSPVVQELSALPAVLRTHCTGLRAHQAVPSY
jgi:putative Mg2+ transporter-C (MgtC) family protein